MSKEFLDMPHAGPAPEHLTVSDLLVNGEFRPAFVTGSLSDQFLPLRWPMQMNRGSSFGAVLRAPAATIVPLDCCYPKAPAVLLLATNQGTLTFKAGEPLAVSLE